MSAKKYVLFHIFDRDPFIVFGDFSFHDIHWFPSFVSRPLSVHDTIVGIIVTASKLYT